MKLKLAILTLSALVPLTFLTGCASSIVRGTPASATVINANMDKNDIEVGAATEGKSTCVTILFGFIRVIDDKNVSFLGLNFFEDQYATTEKKQALSSVPIFGMFFPVNVEDRAYYKALAETPDADTIVPKSFMTTEKNYLIFSKKEVTYQGKALKYKSHN